MIMELIKKSPVVTKFIEEEIVIDIKYVDKSVVDHMIIDSGAPVLIVSSKWLKKYLRDAKVEDEEVKKKSCARRFRLGKTLYVSEMEVEVPVVMKTSEDDFIKRKVIANVIDSEEINFLCGRETLKGWRTSMSFSEDRLSFEE